MLVPQNDSELNQEALRWLKEAKADWAPHSLHLLDLAYWGLENGARGEWPDRDHAAIELQVGHLCGWKPADIIDWLMSNPNGPDDPQEQEENLLCELQNAESPKQAAAYALNVIYSRQVSVWAEAVVDACLDQRDVLINIERPGLADADNGDALAECAERS